MKTTLSLILLFWFAVAPEVSVKYITGTVTDINNQPVSGVTVTIKNAKNATTTNNDGKYSIEAKESDVIVFSYIGFVTETIIVKKQQTINVILKSESNALDEKVIVMDEISTEENLNTPPPPVPQAIMIRGYSAFKGQVHGITTHHGNTQDQESYNEIEENTFKHVAVNPLSTFSADVDRAAYSNIRRMINNGQKVPADAVKIEEMINYFSYDYPQPSGDDPFCINTEVMQTPWNENTQLVRIGIQGKNIPTEDIPASNLVFLLDVSGSMNSPNKLPLLKSAFEILVNQLREKDKVSIVVYAGAAGVVLQPTNGDNKTQILEAMNKLQAGGSTAGGAGINLAYQLAKDHFIDGGNNRIIIATDGDFNVGASSDKAMEELIIEKRDQGIFLTCLGFGMGNYKDSKLETLANKGNGNHAYIDTMQEARKVLGTEFGGTLFTIAKDVKIQVEFNPAAVAGYRLIGYENRLLNAEDFNDDKKDAGEIGSGHSVTALYEVIPAGVESEFLKAVDALKYKKTIAPNGGNELLTVKIRYKKPDGNISKLLEQPVAKSNNNWTEATPDFKFMAGLALFGMQLRQSPYANKNGQKEVIELAEAGRGIDSDGYRAEFIRLVKSSNLK
ncbi:MAG: von Willebrand factor type A domain-containing protein [Leeuwenhoekiella sp.]